MGIAKPPLSYRIVLGLAYIALLMQWAWWMILLLPLLMANDGFRGAILPESQTTQPVVELAPSMSQPVMLIVGGLAVIIAAGITVYALIKMPSFIARNGRKLTKTAAEKTVAIYARHHIVTKQQRKILTERVMWYGNFSLVGVALIGSLITIPFASEVPRDVALVTTGFVGFWPLLWFGLARLIRRVK